MSQGGQGDTADTHKTDFIAIPSPLSCDIYQSKHVLINIRMGPLTILNADWTKRLLGIFLSYVLYYLSHASRKKLFSQWHFRKHHLQTSAQKIFQILDCHK